MLIMNFPPASELREQNTATLYSYRQQLHSEIERTQAILCERNWGGQAALPALSPKPATPMGIAPHEQPREATYRTIVDEQLDLICRFQADFRLTFVNEPYAALCGRASQELIGQNLFDIVPSAYQQQVITQLASLTPQHPVATDENPVYFIDGSVRWFHWTNRFLVYANGTIEYQSVGRDITQLKQAEAAERKQRQLAEAMRDSLATLTSSLDVDQVMNQILVSAATVVDSDANRIGLIRDGYLDIPYLRGYPPETTAWFGAAQYVPNPQTTANRFSPEKAYHIPDTQQKAGWTSFPALAWIRSSLSVPIRVQDQVVGVLVADSTKPNHFQPEDVDTLQTFADYASLALSNAYQANKLEQRVRERTAELQNAEAKFQQLLQAAPIAMIVSDQAGRITLSNHQTELLFGYQATELLGQTVTMLVPEADRVDLMSKRAEQITTAMQQGQTSGRRELFIQCKDGRPVPVEIQTNWIQTADGLLIISFLLDITERKQAADTLRQQRDFLQSVIDHIPSVISIKNRQGKIQLVNQYGAQLLNQAPSDVLGKTSAEVNPNRQEVEQSQQATDQVFATQQKLSVPEILVKGRYYQADVVPIPGTTSVDDKVLLIGYDITERKQAKDALRRQRNFLQSVIDHIPGIIAVKNQQGEFRLANQHTAQLFGLTPEMLVGKTSREVNPNQHEVDLVQRGVDQVLTTQQTLFVPEILLVGRYYEANFIPLPDTMPTGAQVLFVAYDITERKQAQVALQQALQTEKELSELKSGFITTTSHEFRTPLAVILSTTDTLRTYRHKLTNEQIEQRLTRITSQVQHLKGLMEDVLDLSRMQARRFNFTPALRDPASLGRKLITEFQNDAETVRPFIYTFDADLPRVELDEHLLRYILNNLLSNALKYSPDDKPVVIHLASDANALILTVRDEGMGIPAADIKHLFQPFYRASNAENVPGTGLGLNITKEAVALHRGSITVASQVGIGTTFTVTLPLAARA